jgi:hypothetical protein
MTGSSGYLTGGGNPVSTHIYPPKEATAAGGEKLLQPLPLDPAGTAGCFQQDLQQDIQG